MQKDDASDVSGACGVEISYLDGDIGSDLDSEELMVGWTPTAA